MGSAAIGSFILANTVGPKIWTLAARNGWRTVGDFLDYRYNRSVRGTIAVLLWIGTLMILLNYTGVVWDTSNWVLLAGLALILAGIVTATQYH